MDDTIATTAEAHEADAIPRRIEVHTDDTPAKCSPLPEAVAQTPVKNKSPAEWAYERLILYIQNFEEQLDNEHEVAMGFAGGEAGVLRIEGLGYFDPDIVTFYGADADGLRTQLIQHVSQLSVILRALPKEVEQKEPRRIGFQLAKELGTV
ncbi:DUF6173 family protein [Primorskyibacter sp. 2E233]|uniref:DUF6173 family protein n=1 Tax=Primorskyibacter sp. 2E233 TaxID=3413431 RepID=UPI003BEF7B7E